MLEKILRKTIFKNMNKDEQDIIMLRKNKFRLDIISKIIMLYFLSCPTGIAFAILLTSEMKASNIIINSVFMAANVVLLIWVLKRFLRLIIFFQELLRDYWHGYLYAAKGMALTQDDLNKIKEEKAELHKMIMLSRCEGLCFSVCFEILQTIKKGEIRFYAVKKVRYDNCKNEYTLHVLYVKDGWCFDTYTNEQHELYEILNILQAKEYGRFNYEDIKGKTYEQFGWEQATDLRIWCAKNDCFTFTSWEREQ